MKKSSALILPAFTMCLSGCFNPPQDFSGTFQCEGFSFQETLIFNKDRTFRQTVEIYGATEKFETSGVWEIYGDNIRMRGAWVGFDGGENLVEDYKSHHGREYSLAYTNFLGVRYLEFCQGMEGEFLKETQWGLQILPRSRIL